MRTYDPEEVERQRRRIAAGCFLAVDMKDVEHDATDVHWVNAVIPAPQSFRDMDASFKRGRVVYFGSPVAIATYSVVVYALSGAAFAALLAFYSLPSQFVTESVVGTSWSLADFDCEPLQADPYYGVSYSYSECLANIAEPNAETVVVGTAGPGGSQYFNYYPFSNTVSLKKPSSQNNGNYGVTVSGIVVGASDGLYVLSTGATQSQVITAYNQVITFLGGIEGLCEFTKTNSPFQCTREKPIEATQRISLAYAGAMFVYTTLSILFPLFMRVRTSRAEKLKRFIASKGIDIAQRVEEEEAVN